MRIQRKELLVLVVLGVTVAAPASAIPIVFDITATVSDRSFFDMTTHRVTVDHSIDGQAATAQIVIDTEAFETPSVVGRLDHDDMTFHSRAGGSPGISVSLTVGGVTVDTARFSRDRGEVSFYDSYGLVPGCGGTCGSMSPDQYSIRAHSEEFGPDGLSGLTTFQFTAAETFDPLIPGSGMTWLDFTRPVTLDMLLTLPTESPLFSSRLYWSEGTYDCTGQCRQTGMWNTGLWITSLTRSTTSVPEPGTLGLLAVGFAGAMLATRRRQRISAI